MASKLQPSRPPPVVALINASDDTVDMVKRMLETTGTCCLTACHFADLKKGHVDFNSFLSINNPEVAIFDISPPYEENWSYFKTMRKSPLMIGRGAVLTTTNKARLDEVLKEDSHALEIVGLPKDLDLIQAAIKRESSVAAVARLSTKAS